MRRGEDVRDAARGDGLDRPVHVAGVAPGERVQCPGVQQPPHLAGDRARRTAAVHQHQLQGAAEDPAARVDLVRGEHCAVQRGRAGEPERAGLGHDEAHPKRRLLPHGVQRVERIDQPHFGAHGASIVVPPISGKAGNGRVR